MLALSGGSPSGTPGERVVVVTHGGSMRRIQAAVLGVALPVVGNCGRGPCPTRTAHSAR